LSPATEQIHPSTCRWAQYAGAAIPTDDGRYIAALATGIYVFFAPERLLRKISQPPLMSENHRFNDAPCDPAGRFWAGTNATVFLPVNMIRTAVCNRLGEDGPVAPIMREGIGVSKGMGWSPTARPPSITPIHQPAKSMSYD
jgi:sugar lactone lactonase YvrE